MRFYTTSHGPRCNSRTWPTFCQYCGQRVFYFTCDCGCKVFFDELGAPWPKHQCLGYLHSLIETYGREVIERGMAVMMMTPGIDRTYTTQVQQAYEREVWQPAPKKDIIRRDPVHDAREDVVGIVRELIDGVNVFKLLGTSDNWFSLAILGSLAKAECVQITIHTGALASADNYSFTFLVDKQLLMQQSIVKGALIRCQLRSLVVPGWKPIWICDRVRSPLEEN
ncbi:hypothetical protein [Chloroflexus sp.]|uniref:hypothetical protein n=1 Tax=Chloroflexus sp. TaxID=1904827 RepID=UPI002ACECA34|nr:hypothetical protein [Chloroflexus sp.]